MDNVHERFLRASPSEVWALVASLGGHDDRLWPARWPPMRLDRPIGIGATGGHGPIGYTVSDIDPGRSVRFAFDRPRGVHGHHGIDVTNAAGGVLLRHVIHAEADPLFVPVWLCGIRWLHDALIEDLLDRAEREVAGVVGSPASWSPLVRVLRRVAA